MEIKMEYRTLYQKDKSDNVRIWRMEQDGNKYRTISGIKNGNLVCSEWTVTEGKNIGKKNETSPEKQARLEVIAEYKKKLARKYHETENTINDGAKYILPMLANKFAGWGKGKLDWSSVFTQPKLDGARCLVTKDGMFSREGKRFFSAPHISEVLKDFFIDNPNVILDGELYNHNLRDDFNTIMSLIRQQSPSADDLKKSEELIQYHIYDTVSEEYFSDRTGFLHRMIKRINSPLIIHVQTFKVDDSESLDQHYADFLEQGYEGAMIRINAPYEQKRSKTLQKRKEFLDDEFPIISLEEGLGNWAGYAKIAKCRLSDGRIFGAGIKGNQEFTKTLLNGPVPSTVTVRYQNLTPDGIPRFPIAVNFFWGDRDI